MVTMVITALWDSDTLKDCHMSDEGSRFLQNISTKIHTVTFQKAVMYLYLLVSLLNFSLHLRIKVVRK